MLKEYAERRAEQVTVKFESGITAKEFREIAKQADTRAIKKTGHKYLTPVSL